MQYAIETQGLTKRYGQDVLAVDGLDIAVERGTVYGFLGPNGAGKTTTMKMLTTLLPPTEGTATISGVSITDRPRIISTIGYLPEDPPLFDELTGFEQLSYVAYLHDIPDETANARIRDWLYRLDLDEAADRRIGTYSNGMCQKLGIAQTVIHDPTVLFLDEPTSGLDPRASRTVIDVLGALSDSNKTIFLSTHILPVVEELADTIGVIHDGRLVAHAPPVALKRRFQAGDGSLEQVFLQLTDDEKAHERGVDRR